MKIAQIVISGLTMMSLASPALAHEGKEGPCKRMKEACESAGFVKGGHKNGKGLFVDCLRKIKAGEKVEGVTVDSKDVSECKEKVEERKEKRAAKQGSEKGQSTEQNQNAQPAK